MYAPNQGAHLVGNWKRFKSSIRRKNDESAITSGDRTTSRNIDWNPTRSMRCKETERHSTRDCRNGKRDDRRRKEMTTKKQR
jgi:hypothetical protein